MVVVEGVSGSLDPNMNMWETARPIVEKYIAEAGAKSYFERYFENSASGAQAGPQLPKLLEDLIRQHKYEDKN